MKKITLSVIAVLIFATGYSQSKLWTQTSEMRIGSLEKVDRASTPTEYQLFSLDFAGLKNLLKTAPSRENATSSSLIIPFPDANGKMQRYYIYESSVMEPELAAKNPEIQSYVGKGIDDPTASINFSTTIFGLHTMTLSANGTIYIDPYTKDLQNYVVYNKSTLTTNNRLHCEVSNQDAHGKPSGLEFPNVTMASDGKFRTYRLAMACTFEYANFHIQAAGLGGANETQKKNAVLAAMTITVTRVNTAYERDMSLRMLLVANNTSIIYVTSAASDPFSNTNAGQLITQSQNTITSVIGSGNFDIGHTVSTGGGGLASPGVCIDEYKARGITGSPSPVGDPYDIDFVAHEIGHQFGANHTFNSTSSDGTCDENNRSGAQAVEPGSGSTIMAYAGICTENVQSNSDSYFHAVSIAEMVSFIAIYATCQAGVSNANTPPVIASMTNYTIPKGTAFKLTGSATDVNGDNLTYCWEQINANGSTEMPSPTTLNGPVFRSFPPTASPTRYFPSMNAAVNGGSLYEVLPNVARILNFALTVRDNRTPNGGQTSRLNMAVSTNASAGPLLVTSQNTDGISWTQGTLQTITWNVAGTNAAPFNTANVKISLSTDGGLTYPTVLSESTPNNGTFNFNVPAVASAPFCRVMVEAIGNIYYAINTKTFAIGYTVTNVCTTYTNNTPFNVVDGTGTSNAAYGTSALSSITVPGTGSFTSVKVTVNGSHPDVSDWVIGLAHPDNTQKFLWGHSCYTPPTFVTGMNVTFADGSPTVSCTSPITTGTFAPYDALSSLAGKPKNGNWRLFVADGYASKTGTINSWSLEICTQTVVLNTSDLTLTDFKIYPNPNKGIFNVEFNSNSTNDIKVGVYDLRGRLIMDKSYTNTGRFSEKLQLQNVQSGIYLVTVQDGKTKETKKIFVE